MAATAKRPELIVIVGPTASGKSELAFKMAKEFDGEIIAADSRTIYKGMDIGTAKPTAKERKLVPHWGLDLIEPGQAFSAAQFKAYARQKIREIQKRDKLPIIVGGTGLYIDSLVFDFSFPEASSPDEREELESLSIEQMQQIINVKGYRMPENSRNRRHLMRTIERRGQLGTRRSITSGTLLIGVLPEDEIIQQHISRRVKSYFENGIIPETQKLIRLYGTQNLRVTPGIAYKTVMDLLEGEVSRHEAKELIQIKEWQYARRQKTWFRRNKFIQWFSTPEEAYISVKELLPTQH